MAMDLSQPFEHGENMQAFEQEGKILVAVIDQTYGRYDDDVWDRERELFRADLEREFGLRFEDGNIGPGADLPAFITLLNTTVHVPVWTLVASAFFLGKPILENFEAWTKMAKQLHSFLERPAYLNRQGSAVLALEAIFDAIGRTPITLQLLSYRTAQIYEPNELGNMEAMTDIQDPVPTLFLGFVRHIFEVEADGEIFRVSVDGTEVTLLKLSG